MPLRLSAAALSLLLSCRGCAGPDTATDSAVLSSEDRRVVVLVLDGIRLEESFGDGYSDALGMPTADILPSVNTLIEERGALIDGALTTGITITAPGHNDLLTGVRTPFANYPVDDEPGAYLPELPSLLTALPEGEALLATNATLVLPLAHSLSPLSVAPAGLAEARSDRDVFTAMREEMTDSDLRLVVANLHQADSQGHNGPTAGYGEKIVDLNETIPAFWAWIQEQPDWADRTTLVLVADHGRHRWSHEESWRDHGDHCSGCREIPMALIGSGIQPGAVVSGKYTLEDLGQTIAHLLDVPLPYGTGSVINDALTQPAAEPVMTGAVAPTGFGQTLVWQEHTGTLSPRSQIVIGDTVIESDALIAEAPTTASNDQMVVACWRQLRVDDAELNWPWEAHCQYKDSGPSWTDITPPLEEIWAFWKPALMVNEKTVIMASVNNPSGIVLEEASFVMMMMWTEEDGWEKLYTSDVGSFPTAPALGTLDNNALMAVVVGEGQNGRHTRRIDVYNITREGVGSLALRIVPASASKEADLILDVDRLEHPRIFSDAGSAVLSFVSYTIIDGSPVAAVWRGEIGGEFVPLDEGILGHVTPTFSPDGTLHWVRHTDDGPALCTDSADSCTLLPGEAVRGIAAGGDGVWVSVMGANRHWTLVQP